MKKTIFVALALSVLLSGCVSDKYKADLAAGKTALGEKRYDDAATAFSSARAQSPKEAEPQQLLSQLYDSLVSDAGKNFQDKEYKKALALYSSASKINQDSALANRLEEVKKLDASQDKLNEYAKWYKGFSQKYAEQTASFRKSSEEYQIGTIPDAELSKRIKESILPAESLLLSEVEKKGTDVSSDLSAFHSALLKMVQSTHRLILDSVVLANAKNAPGVKENYAAVLSQADEISKLEQSLKAYAEQKKLKLSAQ